jgi:hypothetical protein
MVYGVEISQRNGNVERMFDGTTEWIQFEGICQMKGR